VHGSSARVSGLHDGQRAATAAVAVDLTVRQSPPCDPTRRRWSRPSGVAILSAAETYERTITRLDHALTTLAGLCRAYAGCPRPMLMRPPLRRSRRSLSWSGNRHRRGFMHLRAAYRQISPRYIPGHPTVVFKPCRARVGATDCGLALPDLAAGRHAPSSACAERHPSAR